MTGTATTRERAGERSVPRGKYTHHGRTPAAWAGVVVAFLAFAVGLWGVVIISMPLMIIGGAGLVLAMIVTQVLRVLGYGAD